MDLAKPSSRERYHSLYHWCATDAAMKLLNKDNCSNTLVLAARGAEIKLHGAFTTRPCQVFRTQDFVATDAGATWEDVMERVILVLARVEKSLAEQA